MAAKVSFMVGDVVAEYRDCNLVFIVGSTQDGDFGVAATRDDIAYLCESLGVTGWFRFLSSGVMNPRSEPKGGES